LRPFVHKFKNYSVCVQFPLDSNEKKLCLLEDKGNRN
jgi:hypothetical protein